MDVSKFALDRSAYLNTGALYDSAKSQTNPYSAYLDPTSVLTKAYFDSKMYQDRAQAAANYAYGGGLLSAGSAAAGGLYHYSAAAAAVSQAAGSAGSGSSGSGTGGSSTSDYRRPLTVIF
ncbi:hypothetical protein ZHAS_00015295 [Anopheles sinensis]|uniref:Uncharacterized protein n=1 Tax=Anopheles sinensis TaxID=74873 RepID=A0A084WAM4_ANOSI|nr:hypothetical protein ZHAS_00015295 [Anopheles sinensis]